MRTFYLFLCGVGLVFWSYYAKAAQNTFVTKNVVDGKHKFSIKIPKDWQTAQGFLGMSFSALGPAIKKSNRRPVVAVVAMGDVSFKFKDGGHKDEIESHKKRKIAWIEKNGGVPVSFSQYKFENWRQPSGDPATGYSIASRYFMGGTEMVERLYYMVCKKTLYSVTTLTTADEQKKSNPQFEKILGSFECK